MRVRVSPKSRKILIQKFCFAFPLASELEGYLYLSLQIMSINFIYHNYGRKGKVRLVKLAKPKAQAEQLPDRLIGTSELAAIVGKTPQWIRQLTRDGVLKQEDRGKYQLGKSVQAYIDHVTGNKENNNGPKLVDHKTEFMRIKAEMAELELEEKRKNLHSTADVEYAWGRLLVEFRERLAGLPPKLANDLSYMTDQKGIRVLLEGKINDALIELAKYDPLASDDG